MTDLVLASNNPHKLAEMKAILPKTFTICSQADFGSDEVEETGATFVENALLKARYAAKLSGLPALADDSGLVVDALGGLPGVRSARFAGEPAASRANIDKLLQLLESETNRSAYFVTVLVYLRHEHDPLPLICQGLWHGEILKAPQGNGGFGYDPIFWLAEHNQSAAMLTSKLKNTLSHRAKALQAFICALKNEVVDN